MLRIFRPWLPAAALLLIAGAATAQDFPARPIRVIVPFPAQGGSDVVAHALLLPLQKGLGQPVTLENQPGEAGVVGAKAVAAAPADGYTLLLGASSSMVILPAIKARPDFDPERALAPVGLVMSTPSILTVPVTTRAHTMVELLAQLRAHPGGFTYASTGPGSVPHLTAELFKSAAGVSVAHVPYKALKPALGDLLQGDIGMMFLEAPLVMPAPRDVALKFIAVTSRRRVPGLDAPTIEESGVPGFEAVTWYGLFAPAGTPAPVVARLNAELGRVVAIPEATSALAKRGGMFASMSPQEFTAMLAYERQKWGGLLRTLDMKTD